MYAQSSSARRNREVDSANDHGPILVEATRYKGKVALRVEAMSKRYGAIEALAGVSFDVRQSGVFGLLGLNGAGVEPPPSVETLFFREESCSQGQAR